MQRCESERTRRPHTVVVRDRETRWALAWERFRRKILVALAAFIAVSNGTCGGLLVRYSSGQELIQILGASLLLAAALVPLLLFLWDKRGRNRSKLRERFTLQQRLLGLAYKRRGVLTADDVARSLNIPLPAADAMLDQMVHQQKAEIEVTDRGEIQFVIGQAHLPASGTEGSSATGAPQSAAARAARREASRPDASSVKSAPRSRHRSRRRGRSQVARQQRRPPSTRMDVTSREKTARLRLRHPKRACGYACMGLQTGSVERRRCATCAPSSPRSPLACTLAAAAARQAVCT